MLCRAEYFGGGQEEQEGEENVRRNGVGPNKTGLRGKVMDIEKTRPGRGT